MKSKLQLILMLVFVLLIQSANAQKASKKPELDMVKLMQQRNRVVQKATAQQRQQAADHGVQNQGTEPFDASGETHNSTSTPNGHQATGTRRDNE